MRKFALWSAITILATAPLPAFAQVIGGTDIVAQDIKSDMPIVTLSVAGSARTKPDRAMISAGVQTKAVSAADAMSQNARQMQAVISALKSKGVADKDIQTSSISLTQDYEYGEKGQTFKGYVANNSVSVRMKDVASVGGVLDTLVNAGATNVSGPTFMVENDKSLLQQARLDAMRQAAELSAFYAKSAGYGRARLLSISESQDFSPPMPMAQMKSFRDAGESATTPVEPGEVEKQVSITVKYVLER
jgi:uncharacterized protein YggE